MYNKNNIRSIWNRIKIGKLGKYHCFSELLQKALWKIIFEAWNWLKRDNLTCKNDNYFGWIRRI